MTWVWRYSLPLLLFGLVLGLSQILSNINFKLNLTIPIVFAMVATAWWGGRGPGILLGVFFEGATILYTPRPPDIDLGRIWFGYLSVFLLYVFLVLVITNLKAARDDMRKQRDLLEVTLQSIGDAVIATDPNGCITFMNGPAERMTAWDSESAKDRPLGEVFQIVNEQTGQTVENPVNKVLISGGVVGLANHTILIAKDGKRIPIDDTAAPIKEGDAIRGVVLVFSDVTERKAAERAQREKEIMGRIVEAQESERRRIARDLHDHLGQKMTALRLKIGSITSGNDNSTNALAEVEHAAVNIDRDIGFLSWELRPTELEELGLENALGTFVREWSDQHGVTANFHSSIGSGQPVKNSRLPVPVETNLYRIVQEALNNILKHADAKNVEVLLQRDMENISLIIEDDGNGFDPTQNGHRGLGLIGMNERAALLKGTCEIDSTPDAGTTIIIRVPSSIAAD